MTNKIYAGLLFLAVTICTNFSFSQFYLGAQANYAKYFGGSGINSIGLGANGEFAVGDAGSVRIGLNYGFPSKQDMVYSLTPNNSMDNYSQVDGTRKIGLLGLNLDYKHFFFDGDIEDGGFYVFVGAGLSIATLSYQPGTYDETRYSLGFDPEEKERLFQPTLRVGPGYDISLDKFNLFVEGFLSLPASQVGGSYIEVSIPASAGFQAGIKFPLGN